MIRDVPFGDVLPPSLCGLVLFGDEEPDEVPVAQFACRSGPISIPVW